MKKPTRSAIACAVLGVAGLGGIAWSSGHDEWEEGFSPPPPFAGLTAAIGGVRPAAATPAYLASSRIAAVGERVLVSDADSGMLLLADASGAPIAQLAIGREAGLLAYDPVAQRAYVADRRGDRLVVVAVGDQLSIAHAWRTPAEPYGVALAPDRKTVLVTTIADRMLVAFDSATGKQAWRAQLAPEPRGIAIAPDGKRALVTSLTSGAVGEIALDADRKLVRTAALPVAGDGRHARGSFTAAFLGNELAVIGFQIDTPVARFPDGDHYGGSSTPPIEHQLAWVGSGGRQASGVTNINQPRALAWDASRDVLYVAGIASDHVVAIGNASQVDVKLGDAVALGHRCGADGLALSPSGSVLVWCSFTRTIARFDVTAKGKLAKVQRGPELVASTLDADRHAGMVLFHTANDRVSAFGGMSCAGCHLDGRADGVSWRIKKSELQTPIIAGRIAETGPFKWDGTANDLTKSLRETVGRLGGSGLSKKQLGQLATFVEAMPAIRTPTRDAAQVARGKRLFESAELGCAVCHDGARYTDRERHQLGSSRVAFDTPGLGGLAASAPYFHDGSAPTLEAALRDRGKVHGMAEAATELDGPKLADLIAFLETL